MGVQNGVFWENPPHFRPHHIVGSTGFEQGPLVRVPYIWSAFWYYFFYHSQNHWKLSDRKYLMPVKITVSTTKWTISDTKCCWSAQQLRDLHSGSCANRAHLEDYRRKLSWASLIFSRSPKMTIFWPFLEKTENSRIQMYGTRRYINYKLYSLCVWLFAISLPSSNKRPSIWPALAGWNWIILRIRQQVNNDFVPLACN